jgi:hypothetical protein
MTVAPPARRVGALDPTLAAETAAAASDAPGSAALPLAQPHSDQRMQVQLAFALGWQVSDFMQLLHVVMAGERPAMTQAALNPSAPAWTPRLLTSVSDMDADDRADLLRCQVVTSLKALQMDPNSELSALLQGGYDVRALSAEERTALRTRLVEGHEKLLIGLTASGSWLGTAYSLGVALSETVNAACGAVDDCVNIGDPRFGEIAIDEWNRLLDIDRLGRMVGQLRALKSYFAPFTSEPVAATLQDWGNCWTTQVPDGRLGWLRQHRGAFCTQGTLWREMLSGEKHPTDELNVRDYISAAMDVAQSYRQIAKTALPWGAWGWAALALSMVALGAAAVWLTVDTNRVAVAVPPLLGILGLLGLSGATLKATLGTAMRQVETSLWDSEVTAAIAIAIDQVPTAVANSHVALLRSHALEQRADGTSLKPKPTPSRVRRSPPQTPAAAAATAAAPTDRGIGLVGRALTDASAEGGDAGR